MTFAARMLGPCYGCDTATKLFASTALNLARATLPAPIGKPIDFFLRYVSLGAPNFVYDISPSERDVILGTGKALGLVQHVERASWQANPQVGAQHGKAAAIHARLVSYPAGCDVACDMEGVGDPGAQAEAYYVEWLKPVQDAGFCLDGGVEYEGYDSGLSLLVRQQLYAKKVIGKSWKDYGARAPIPGVGWVLEQHAQITLAGVGIDPDEAMVALDGAQFVFMVDADLYSDAPDKRSSDTIPVPSSAYAKTDPPPRP